MDSTGAIVGPIVGVAAFVTLVVLLVRAIKIVKEKEMMVVERLGRFQEVLTAGVHAINPFLDRPKVHSVRYFVTDAANRPRLVEKNNLSRVSTQNEVLDFPKQRVITRDNATAYLDAVLSYVIVNPKQMIYSVQNVPMMLSRITQSALRNVAGSLDLDQIIEDSTWLNIVKTAIDQEATRWGVQIVFVRIQNISMPDDLQDLMAAKKNADLKNQETIISAKAKKQTAVLESEGLRDAMIQRAEGEASEMIARARGEAQAIVNRAVGEAQSINEIARAVTKHGEDPAEYLLALKYIEALRAIVNTAGTDTHFLPDRSAIVQTLQQLGIQYMYSSNRAVV